MAVATPIGEQMAKGFGENQKEFPKSAFISAYLLQEKAKPRE